MEEKNYKEVFTVIGRQTIQQFTTSGNNISLNQVGTNFTNKVFSTYNDALNYINDMLKYHEISFEIIKSFVSNKSKE